MISNKQKWLLGGLVTLSAAIWTPQAMERFGGATSSQVSVDAGPNEDEMLSIEMESMGQAPGAGASTVRRAQAGPGGGASAGSGSAGSAPGDALVGGGELTPGGSSAIVSEVLRTLRQSEAFKVDDGPEEPVRVRESEETVVDEEAPQLPGLFAFIQANPLRGTIVGETTNMALIGKHRVHLGDMVPGTGATLTEVSRGRATLTEGSMTFELELKPLETSEALMLARSQSQAQSQGSSGLAGLPETETPGADITPSPTNDAQAPATSELPGSTGEF